MGLLFFSATLSGQVIGSSLQRNPVMSFSSPGNKQVKVQVCNAVGCTTVTRTIVVLDPRPSIASVASVPAVLGTGQTVTLSAQTAGRPALTHRWVISGGPTNLVLTGNPATWNTAVSGIGTYSIHLEVQNADGLASSAPVPVSVVRMTFADVPPTYWAWQSIEAMYSHGITTGCAANPARYCPVDGVLRSEMAVFLTRASHGSTFVPAMPVGVFADAPPAYWAAAQIEQIYNDGITTGCAANPLRFCPGNLLTRAEMAIFLVRARHGAAYTPPPATGLFADVPAGNFAAPWVEQLYIDGITTGCAAGPLRFCPGDNVSRDQMAAFLVRTFNLTLP